MPSSSSLTCTKLALWTIAAVILQIIGLFLFVLGFFPIKPALSGISGPESYRVPMCGSVEDPEDRAHLSPEELKSLYQEMSQIPPSFDRLVLMVVDGLPAEFVLGNGDQPPTKVMMESMPYTQSLLSNGTAIGFHAKAAPPTVTMPRLKAMVSGAVGGFLDLAFNFNAQALLDDNLLGQLFSIGWKMVMLGDETWIKLFPGLFTRQDGVSSFFVKDTIEVDHNVSRHLETELATDDWNLLILHYLGVDHVGHIGGRNNILMIPKLKEMDEVVQRIHQSAVIDSRNGQTLLLQLLVSYSSRLLTMGGIEDVSIVTIFAQLDSYRKCLFSAKRQSLRDSKSYPIQFWKKHNLTYSMVVSDHGMTDNGNHGGSSYEETDSLALFIGLRSDVPDYVSATRNEAFQVDIAPTLALLFGVPIPRNNIGVLISEAFDSLTGPVVFPFSHLTSKNLKPRIRTLTNLVKEDQQLRALELNSWQLMRLLQAQLPGLLWCNSSSNEFNDAKISELSECKGSVEQKLCCLFSKAAALHNRWIRQESQGLRSNMIIEFRETVAVYKEYLRFASEWLSRGVTDKPLNMLAVGIAAMILSCIMFLSIQSLLYKTFHVGQSNSLLDTNDHRNKWHVDETFVLIAMLSIVLSLGSSSMVEEEQYTWHFVTSSLFVIFLRKSSQSLPIGLEPSLRNVHKGHKYNYTKACSIILVLICGRLLRGWHQGGVNWVHLPDISKWLEKAGPRIIKSFQVVSGLIVNSLSTIVLYRFRLKKTFFVVFQIISFIAGVLVLLHIVNYQNQTFAASSSGSLLIIQMIYAILIMTVMVAVLGLPWLAPISCSNPHSNPQPHFMASVFIGHETEHPFSGLRVCMYLIGWTYSICWCCLQLLLQQPINAMPVLLLLVQVLAIVYYFSVGNLQHKQWIEVAALYFLGMTGHFSLGNSNTLATIDVAGAYMGISNHSTVLSGILMFAITYASPIFCLFSLMLYIALKDISFIVVSEDTDLGHLLQMTIGFPCLVPLSLNSVMLTTFTVILLLMRSHLFIWSVFSPKYMYVCATTVCIYVGVFLIAATEVYACSVFLSRRKRSLSRQMANQ